LVRLKTLSGAEVCALLEEHGFRQVRQKGSHAVLQKWLGDTTITVPVPLHKEIRIGTLQSIIRQSGLNRAIFETP
jgi:predicted RNA binding protein YcfA (HicA-like mRNA interferase family)